MTAQISDIAIYNDKEYSIIGINGEGLFDPYQYDLEPVGTCSACWRGFMVGYLIRDDRLLVDVLNINFKRSDKKFFWNKRPPKLNGVKPGDREDEEFGLFDYNYSNLNLPIEFSGGVLLGNDFIHELYVHMGFQDPWKYREVHEFVFDKGKLSEHRDVSEKMKQYREMVEGGSESQNGFDSLHDWINDCFSLDYEM